MESIGFKCRHIETITTHYSSGVPFSPLLHKNLFFYCEKDGISFVFDSEFMFYPHTLFEILKDRKYLPDDFDIYSKVMNHDYPKLQYKENL